MNEELDEKGRSENHQERRQRDMGGARPNTGGRRPGSGRKKGTVNRVAAEIKEMARQYGPEAIAELARLAKHALSEQARVAAIKELLDRGYGRSVQPVVGTLEHGAEAVNGCLTRRTRPARRACPHKAHTVPATRPPRTRARLDRGAPVSRLPAN